MLVEKGHQIGAAMRLQTDLPAECRPAPYARIDLLDQLSGQRSTLAVAAQAGEDLVLEPPQEVRLVEFRSQVGQPVSCEEHASDGGSTEAAVGQVEEVAVNL